VQIILVVAAVALLIGSAVAHARRGPAAAPAPTRLPPRQRPLGSAGPGAVPGAASGATGGPGATAAAGGSSAAAGAPPASPGSAAAAGATGAAGAAPEAQFGRTFFPARDDRTWRPMIRSEVAPESIRLFSSGLPSLPIAANRLATALEDPRTDPRTIARIAATDPSLAARFLMVVNSVYFGLPKRTGDLNRAVMLLGYSQIKGIVFRSIVNETLSKDAADVAMLDRLWERSYLVSLASPILAQALGGGSSQNLSTAGLFLDVGKIALLARFGDKARLVYGERLTDDHYAARREEDAFGINHAVAGALLAEKWKLPPDVVALIECHIHAHFWTAPYLPAEEMKTIAVLHLAQAMVDRFMTEQSADETQPALVEPDLFYFHLFGIEPPVSDHVSPRLIGALHDGQAFLAQLGPARGALVAGGSRSR